MSVEANIRVAKDFLFATGHGDLEGTFATVTDDVVLHTMGSSAVSASRDHAALAELVKAFGEFMSTPVEFEILTVTAQDDRVAVEACSSATMVDGRPYENIYHFLFWFRDGRIASAHEYMDTKYADEALLPLLKAGTDATRAGGNRLFVIHSALTSEWSAPLWRSERQR
jgi:ketosteroid isomerase-like protein